MTEEDKQLLFKDLSARLSYGVKVTYNISGSHYKEISTICGWELRYGDLISFKLKNGLVVGCNIKPYLRPMDSMTKEEKKEYFLTWKDEPLMRQVKVPVTETDDWLEAHHFDYRGLIEKGLALEAPEGMYNKN